MILEVQGIEKRPPRPCTPPIYGWTAKDRVVVLLDLSPRDWDRLDIRGVTGLVPDGRHGAQEGLAAPRVRASCSHDAA